MSPTEIMIVMAIAVLIFGKRLPDVARSAGKTLAEFRKTFQGIQDQITGAATGESQPARTVYHDDADDNEEATAPKFESPPRPQRAPSEPVGQASSPP